MFKDIVTSREELRAIFGAPGERAVLKERAHLDVHTREFIARSPFVLLATVQPRRAAATSLRRATRPAS